MKDKPKKVTKAPLKDASKASSKTAGNEDLHYAREYWTGDSRDGAHVNADGYHYYKMQGLDGLILEAYEYYEKDDGTEVVSPLPEMIKVSWKNDLGFEDWDALDKIEESVFNRIKNLIQKP